MRWQQFVTMFAAVGVLALTLTITPPVYAQGFAGVHVDAENVLRMNVVQDRGGRLMHQRLAAAQAKLDAQVAATSKLRKISLNRLEDAIATRIEQGQEPTEEMLVLAGLQRLEYVFYYPETKDIVIAGPAEGWVANPVGRVVGINTARPVLHLEDLVTALRAYPSGKKGARVVGCSIDPTQEGLQRLQQFLARVGRSATPAQTRFLVKGLKESLGLQTVSVYGVPASTRMALTLVEADYRMKLIGIGLEKPRVRLASYVDLANPNQVAANAMQRWYFTPNYDCVKVTDDKLGMQLVGLGVQLVGEDEVVAQNGQRGVAGSVNAASQRWVKGFTQKYEDIAQKTPVYAELRNMIDLTIAAAFIQQQGYYKKAGWDCLVFGNEKLFEVEKYNAPKHVESAVNSIWKGRRLMTPIGGGVEIRPGRALSAEYLNSDDNAEVQQARQSVKLDLAEGQWWWD